MVQPSSRWFVVHIVNTRFRNAHLFAFVIYIHCEGYYSGSSEVFNVAIVPVVVEFCSPLKLKFV